MHSLSPIPHAFYTSLPPSDIYVAYDLDGVFSKESRFLSFLFRHTPCAAVFFRDSELNRCMHWPTIKEAVIVTGRPTEDSDSTLSWLRFNSIELSTILTIYTKHINDLTRDQIIEQSSIVKIHFCNKHQVKTFVESDLNVIQYMKTRMSGTEVIGVPEALDKGLLTKSMNDLGGSYGKWTGTQAK